MNNYRLWESIHPNLRWGRTFVESVLAVFERPRYGLVLTGLQGTITFGTKTGGYLRDGLQMSCGLHRDQYRSGAIFSVHEEILVVEVNCAAVGYSNKLVSYRSGRGKTARRLSRFGEVDRPGVRKWAVYTIQSLQIIQNNNITSQVSIT